MPIDLDSDPTVIVTGTVRAPVDKVWALFAPFGEPIMKWWPIFEWVKLEDGKDELGAVRHFKTKTGRTYREKLVSRDDATYTERYDMLSVEPAVPTFAGAVTKITMTDAGDGTTHIDWRSWSDASRMLLGQIKAAQAEVYEGAIVALDRAFNPALGTLQVTVVAAKGLKNDSHFPTNPYVLVELDDQHPVKTKACHFTANPTFNQSFTLDVLDIRGRLRVSAWDERLGRDASLGSAHLDLHEIAAGKRVTQTLELVGSEGADGGSVSVELLLALHEGEALPETEEQQALHHMTVIENALAKLQKQAMQLVQQAGRGPQKTWGYARYERSPQLPDVPLEDLPRTVEGLPPEEVLSPEKLSQMARRGIEYLYSQSQFLARAEKDEDPYSAYFGGWIEPPKYVVANWKDDRELARQFIQGCGPMVIERLTDLDRLPAGMKDLTPGGESLTDLLAQKRLFFLDYAPLAELKPYRDMFFYAPYVLVYKEKNGGLTLGAIQLTRDGGDAVYTPGKTPPNRWALAKMHVACADNQYHQWLLHLGYAHLAMEPFVVAWHDGLPADHPVSVLLAPHFHDTIGINFLARQTLVSDVAPFTDRTFSTGTAQALQMFLGAWKKYDFFERSFPNELAARGFDEKREDALEGYYYRDDGFLVWNAIGEYVRDFVSAAYSDDAAVASDAALKSWVAESTAADKADIPGFPEEIADKETLVNTLQTLIWAVSAAHSAVNFSQYDYLSYVPNRPDSLFRAMPEGDGEIDAQILQDALPNPMISHFQISFSWLLTTPSEHPLTTINALEKRFPEVHQRFQQRLAEVSEKITARNAELEAKGECPYPYLLPERVASSIAV